MEIVNPLDPLSTQQENNENPDIVIDKAKEIEAARVFAAELLERKLILDTKTNQLTELRKARADRLLIKSLDKALLALKIEYFEKAGLKFAISAEDIAYEFVYNYYDILDYERGAEALLSLYQSTSTYNIAGYSKFFGTGAIIKAITEKFLRLQVQHIIKSVEVDESPPRRCALYLKAYSTLQLEDDRPRLILEIFELGYLDKEDFGAAKYYISNQILTVLDSRPLYSWAEAEIATTTYDNTDTSLAKLVAEEEEERSRIRALEEKESLPPLEVPEERKPGLENQPSLLGSAFSLVRQLSFTPSVSSTGATHYKGDSVRMRIANMFQKNDDDD